MRILLGSGNVSKKNALNRALQELDISNCEIICFRGQSEVSSKPIGYEIIRGAENRNKSLRNYARHHGLEFDYLCSIEGGFSIDENGRPFVVTYAVIENVVGKKSTGKSLGVRITSEMFEFIKQGYSLNKAIEKITGRVDNKECDGIIGYLSGGKYSRERIDAEAVISAFIPIIYHKERDELIKEVKAQLNQDA